MAEEKQNKLLGDLVADTSERLTHRPAFRIRTRLSLSFLVIFALCAVVISWIFYILSTIQERSHFLEVADMYMSEVQQARRYEKNFLLYGTAIEQALSHSRRANGLLRDNREMVERVLGTASYESLSLHISYYQRLLERIHGGPGTQEARSLVPELRDHGAKMVSYALELSKRERDALDRAFVMARRVPFVFLGVLLVLMLIISAFLTRQILGTLARFMNYAKRIGEGDFSPIAPARKYQDEFSQLALAFNQMVLELDSRHQALVESHKLRAIGNLVAGVAHELNNPLNNIMITASLMGEDFDDLSKEELKDMISDVIGEADRSQKIVRNLLDFARQSEVTVEPLHLAELLDNAVRLVANQVKLAKVKLETSIEDNLPPIHGDSQMLGQVFVNIILNALDALEPGGHIRIREGKSSEAGFLAVSFEDDGHGIPAHQLDRIFDPFFTTKTKGRGTGLGLSVSRGMVRKLGGFIRVESQVGEGTTFTVQLPTTDVPCLQPREGPETDGED